MNLSQAGFADGTVWYSMFVRDDLGNVVTVINGQTFTWVSDAPTSGSLTTPFSGQSLQGTFTASASISDQNGLDKVTLHFAQSGRLLPFEYPGPSGGLSGTSYNLSQSVNLASSGFTSGTVWVSIFVRDDLGNSVALVNGRTFNWSAASSPPSLSSPADKAARLNTTPHVFSFSTVSGATSYRLYVDNHSGFGSPEINVTGGTTIYSYVALPNNVYYWKVQALVSGVWGPWSAVRQFVVDTPPPAPAASSPASGASFSSGSAIGFSWSAPSGITNVNRYYLRVVQGTNLNNAPLFNQELTSLSASVPTSGWSSGTYTWGIRAIKTAPSGYSQLTYEQAIGWGAYVTRTFTLSATTTETVSTPVSPTGATSFNVNTIQTFSTSGAASNQGHGVEYRFDWGDGTFSGWGPASRSHSWSSGGSFGVRAQARCSTHTTAVSSWSASRSVTVNAPSETVSSPGQPTGATSFNVNTTQTFSTSGAASNQGHGVEYRFDWGDGTFSGWGPASQSHSWSSGGSFGVRAQARCSTHTTIVSGWSSPQSLTVSGQQLPLPPSAVLALVVIQDRVQLLWSDNSSDEDGFRVYRGGVLLGTTGGNVTGFLDNGVTAGQTYVYEVSSYNGAGESTRSTTGQVSVPTNTGGTAYADSFRLPVDAATIVKGVPSATGVWYDIQPFGAFDYNPNQHHLGADINRTGGDLDHPIYMPANARLIYKSPEAGEGPGWGRVLIFRAEAPPGQMFVTGTGRELSSILIQIAHVYRMEFTIPGTPPRTLQYADLVANETVALKGWQIATVGAPNMDYTTGAPIGTSPPHLHMEIKEDLPGAGTPGPGYSVNTSGRFDPLEFVESNASLDTQRQLTFHVHAYDTDANSARLDLLSPSPANWDTNRADNSNYVIYGYCNFYRSAPAQVGVEARWTLSVPYAGDYRVDVLVPQRDATASVRYVVYRNGVAVPVPGSPNGVVIDQSTITGNINDWQSLTTLQVVAGDAVSVGVFCDTLQQAEVAADTIRLVRVVGGSGGGGSASSGSGGGSGSGSTPPPIGSSSGGTPSGGTGTGGGQSSQPAGSGSSGSSSSSGGAPPASQVPIGGGGGGGGGCSLGPGERNEREGGAIGLLVLLLLVWRRRSH